VIRPGAPADLRDRELGTGDHGDGPRFAAA
jgi:hypothetical protein